MSLIRVFVLIGSAVMGIKWFWTYQKKRKIQEDDQILEQYYDKDDNGLYPWEVDIDDSPTRLKDEKIKEGD